MAATTKHNIAVGKVHVLHIYFRWIPRGVLCLNAKEIKEDNDKTNRQLLNKIQPRTHIITWKQLYTYSVINCSFSSVSEIRMLIQHTKKFKKARKSTFSFSVVAWRGRVFTIMRWISNVIVPIHCQRKCQNTIHIKYKYRCLRRFIRRF